MFDAFTEAELLAWVEETLDPAERLALQQRLESAPRALAVLERMREDRDLLRSSVGPAMPMNFLDAIEPQLARPMLIESNPGAYRRRYQRRKRSRSLRHAAAAAGVMLLVAGSIWMALQSLPGQTPPDQLALADSSGALTNALTDERTDSSTQPAIEAPAARDRAAAGNSVAPLGAVAGGGDSVVHHRRPLPSSAAPRVVPGPGQTGNELTSVTFALVLETSDMDDAEQAIEASLAGLDASGSPVGAFVRHFNDQELRLIIDDLQDARARSGASGDELRSIQVAQDAMNGSTRPRIDARDWSALEGPIVRRRAQSRAQNTDDQRDTVPIGRQLRGAKERSPGYADQLELSRRGITHTVTVPIDRLTDLLASVHDRASTRLTMLSVADESSQSGKANPPSASLQQWVTDLRAMQNIIAGIRAEHGDDAYVMLPVIVRANQH